MRTYHFALEEKEAEAFSSSSYRGLRLPSFLFA